MGSVRLTPVHGRLLERALDVMRAEARRSGVRSWQGIEELEEVARQLATDGARVVVTPSSCQESSGVVGGRQVVDGGGDRVHGAPVTRLLSRDEAARYLGVSVSSVDRLVIDGSLRCRRIGRRVMFDLDSLNKDTAACA